mmetsp:Transcript_91513/g.273081  ORF Transcript_91513/g.273081 Transcript_91513/m.273081 type:complete len:270 (+) Transcript_91513:96-905(+)|eukprot:CAMPEP_0175365750 /NCGR_PEP_ID=MMETSP0095-20121207/18785_1 /TAXON_ID=311494 /ORGANISM="Alexandrium monilatum, Strain CCMP3105" /LENGTH=269 /DNA_ID=CAMNT_0016663741 /DNA_START=37 /DNA_END=846 /DNA_ORIENTATION=-
MTLQLVRYRSDSELPQLEDFRRAVPSDLRRQLSAEELKAPLPVSPPCGRRRSRQEGSSHEDTVEPSLIHRIWCGAAGRLATMCSPKAICSPRGARKGSHHEPQHPQSPQQPPRRWYRVYPINDVTYFVRPDAGFRGRIPGLQETPQSPARASRGRKQTPTLPVGSHVKQRRRSLPPEVERHLGLPESQGMVDNNCRVCYDEPAEVVLLPCRHGGLCETCLQRAIHMRPRHRGGRQCPFCRRQIREVIRLYHDAVFPSYGYAIKADCYTR